MQLQTLVASEFDKLKNINDHCTGIDEGFSWKTLELDIKLVSVSQFICTNAWRE